MQRSHVLRMDPPRDASGPSVSSAASSPGISAVACRLPPFSAKHPDVWFLQAEASFRVSHITSQETRFNHLQQSLPIEIAVEVRDILANPPTTNPYDTLKAAILSRTSPSERQRFQGLLSAEELGDRRPSQLLHELQTLLGDAPSATDSRLLKELFLRRLPSSVQMILATASDLPLSALAAHADKIMEVATLHPPLSTVASAQSSDHTTVAAPATPLPSPLSDDLAALRERMQNLEELVASAGYSSPPPRNPRARRFGPSRRTPSPQVFRQEGTTRQPPQHPDSLCWYHRRFGAAAQRCTRPCGWPGNGTRDR